jgi:hypothetical protein
MQRNIPLPGYLAPAPLLAKKLGPTTGLGVPLPLPITATGDGTPLVLLESSGPVVLFGNANITDLMMQAMAPLDGLDVSVPTTALGLAPTLKATYLCGRRAKRPGRKGTGVGR